MSYYSFRFHSRGMSNYMVELPNEQYSKAELIEAIVSQHGEFLVSQGISRTRLNIVSGGRSVEDGFCPNPNNWALDCMFKKDLDEDMGIIRNGSISMAARINAFGRIACEFCRSTTPDQLKDRLLLEVIDAYSVENGYSFAFDLAQEGNAEGFNYWVGTHGGIELISTRMSMAPENITTFLIRRETEARRSSMPALTSYSNPILNSLLSVQAIHTSLTTGAALTFDVPNSETDFRQKALFEFSQFFKGPSFTAIVSSLAERPRLMEASIPFLKKFPNISLGEIQAFGIDLMKFEDPKRYTSNLDMKLDVKICEIGWIINKLQLPAVTASAMASASGAGGPSAKALPSSAMAFGAGPSGAGGPSADTAVLGAGRD
ncbi:MAG: hypothetical protein NTV32_08390 [Gammaproteobacteria bacterium]|nr:hypothetical protein [Gammaproteobacteria bacterium]